jgi:hypothetical protein
LWLILAYLLHLQKVIFTLSQCEAHWLSEIAIGATVEPVPPASGLGIDRRAIDADRAPTDEPNLQGWRNLLFGSGLSVDEWPAKIGAIVAAIEEVPFLTAEERANIFYNNGVRFLRLNNERNAKPRS